MAEFFAGKSWKEISAKLLRNEYIGDGSACLAFMSPKAFRYYLPAYMTIAITEYDDADMVADTAVYALNPEVGTNLYIFQEKRFQWLDVVQIKCITAFLKFMLDNHGEDFREDGLIETGEFWFNRLRHTSGP